MLISSNAFNMLMIEISAIALPSSVNTKCDYYKIAAQQAGLALVKGESYTGPLFTVTNPGSIPYTSGTMVCEFIDVDSTVIDFTVTALNGSRSVVSMPRASSGLFAANVVGTMVKLYAEYFLIEQSARNRGVGLTSVMRAQMSNISARIDDISDRSALLALSAEQVAYCDGNSVFVTGTAPVVGSLTGYSIVRAGSTPLLSKIDAFSTSIKARTIAAIDNLSGDVYDSEIGALGIADWLNLDSWIVKFQMAGTLSWTPDKYSARMAATNGSAMYHAQRFIKRYFSGDSVAAFKVGSSSFSDLYSLVSGASEVSDVPVSMSQYLLSLDILSTSVVDICASLAAIEMLQDGTIAVDVEAKTTTGEYLASLAHLHPATWPDHYAFNVIGNDEIENEHISIRYSSEVDEAYLGVAQSIARLSVEDMKVIRDLSSHFAFVLSLFHHASHVGDVKAFMTSAMRLRDSVGALRSLGLEYLMYPGDEYVIK